MFMQLNEIMSKQNSKVNIQANIHPWLSIGN